MGVLEIASLIQGSCHSGAARSGEPRIHNRGPRGYGFRVLGVAPHPGMTRAFSFQACNVSRHSSELVWSERHHGHVVTGLERLRIGNPGGKRAAGVLEDAGGDGAAAPHVGEVRSEAACGRGAANGMAGGAGLADEDLLSRLLLLIAW